MHKQCFVCSLKVPLDLIVITLFSRFTAGFDIAVVVDYSGDLLASYEPQGPRIVQMAAASGESQSIGSYEAFIAQLRARPRFSVLYSCGESCRKMRPGSCHTGPILWEPKVFVLPQSMSYTSAALAKSSYVTRVQQWKSR